MRKTTLVIMVLFLACHWSLNAQNAKLKKARYYMESLYYQGAIEIYQQILEKDEHPEAMTNLAIAYKKTNQYEAAIPWFAKAVELPDTRPEVFYYYGQALQHSGSCTEAKLIYQQFLKLRPYDLRRKYLESPCMEKDKLLGKGEFAQYKVENLPINGPLDDLGPAFYQDGLVFGSIKAPEGRKKIAFFDLYYADGNPKDPFVFETADPFSSALNSSLHEAIVTFSQDEQKVYITRNRQEEQDPRRNPVIRLEILSAEKLGLDQWSEPEPLPFNDPSFSVAHPCLAPSGDRLFFSSDMPGGFGGKDIYLSFWDGSAWGNPINLGPGINTEGDELSPFFDKSGNLYFASDGHFGLGGQDVYQVKDKGDGQWSEVVNLGPPVNTKDDDFGFIIHADNKHGYFTSNRSGGVGADDIYGFIWEEPVSTQNYRFKVVNGQSRERVTLVTAKIHEDGRFLTADQDGYFNMEVAKGECFSISFVSDGFEPKHWEDCVSIIQESANEVTIGLQALRPPAPEPAEATMYFDLEVVDNLSGGGVAGAEVVIADSPCGFAFKGVTDERGWVRIAVPEICCSKITIEAQNYFLHRSEKVFCDVRRGEVRNFLLQPYIRVQEEEIVSRSTASNPQDTIKVPFKVSQSSKAGDEISYLLNIYYNVGRTSVKKESVPELFKLLDLVKDNPELIIEISSHTDARGGASFNQNLSQRRANNIVNWLVGEGVSKRRLIAKGYGEEKPVNDCIDGKECEEEEYQLNRRTEFRVIGRLD